MVPRPLALSFSGSCAAGEFGGPAVRVLVGIGGIGVGAGVGRFAMLRSGPAASDDVTIVAGSMKVAGIIGCGGSCMSNIRGQKLHTGSRLGTFKRAEMYGLSVKVLGSILGQLRLIPVEAK